MPKTIDPGACLIERIRTRSFTNLFTACLGAMLLLPQASCREESSETPAARVSEERGRTVVLYVSADEYVAREVMQAFERETGIKVQMVGDTEAKKTTGLVERLRAERRRPVADVFWSSEIFQTIPLAQDGILASYRPADTEHWPERFRDQRHRWYGFAARARVIAFDPKRMTAEEVPGAWFDLTDPKWNGRIVMADPRFGTTGGHLGAMKVYWTETPPAGNDGDASASTSVDDDATGDANGESAAPQRYQEFLVGLARNNVRILPSGNAGAVQAVVRGEADLALTDTDDVWAAQAQEHSIDLVYPRHAAEGVAGGGTLLIPNTAGLVRGGPHPEEAKELMDFLLSAEVEIMLAESDSHNVPLRPGLTAEFEQYAAPMLEDPLDVDFAEAAALREDAVKQAMAQLAGIDAEDAGEVTDVNSEEASAGAADAH